MNLDTALNDSTVPHGNIIKQTALLAQQMLMLVAHDRLLSSNLRDVSAGLLDRCMRLDIQINRGVQTPKQLIGMLLLTVTMELPESTLIAAGIDVLLEKLEECTNMKALQSQEAAYFDRLQSSWGPGEKLPTL